MADFASGLIAKLSISSPTVQTSSGNVLMGNSGVCVVNKTSGAATQVTLPARAKAGDCAFVKDGKGDAGTNNITVIPDATTYNTTIDSGASFVLSTNYAAALFMHNGTEWNQLSVYDAALTQAELAFLDGVTAGTGLASKALVLDSSGDVTMPDLGSIGFGGVGKISWDTSDANANKMHVQLPAGGGVDVPVIMIGQSIEGVDQTIYDGAVDPVVVLLGVGAVSTGPRIDFRKSRGTAAAPTVVTSGDDVGTVRGYAAVAAGEWVQSVEMRFDCAGTIATTRAPGTITFLTATDAAPSVLTSALVIGANQVVVPQSGFTAKSLSAGAITTTRVLTVQDSGGIFSVAKASAYAITLPTPSQGIIFKFLVLDTGANIVTISDGSAHLFGQASINSINVVMVGTTISLASGGSIGDWISFEGIDATHYIVTGASLAAAKITIA